MAEKEAQKSYHIPKFIWLVLAVSAVLLIGLGWWNGRSASPAHGATILYLGWNEGELINQLYTVNPAGGEAVRLTETPYGIVNYAVSPDGAQVAYSAANEDESIDLWLMDREGKKQKRLWACEKALCTNPIWAVDGRRLIVERRALAEPGAVPEAPQLWWVDTQTGETLPVFSDTTQTGYGAQLSPDNEWLSFTLPEAQEIQVTQLETGESITIPSQTGEPAVWHPAGEALLISDIWYQGESFSQHLFSVDLTDAELTNISGPELETNDGLPVFSPDGEWLAFGRKKPQAPMGRQLWLMRPDGSETRAITENAEIHYNNPAWSLDGSQIVMQAYTLAEPQASPKLWLVDVASGELTELASPGIQPTWLP